ncbi:MAG: zf-HC2 domain-containing protein [Candidatus Delongbacteria bacterium]|nr:zf-HC2 domain-containing protein [Candidatus Delongbacteria bacterium]MCG2759934.1 zf-HC2 domain-containing protein [Candidatus Delongbacteria bacterium]
MNCEEYREMIPEFISGELDRNNKIDLEKHISECDLCKKEYEIEISILSSLSIEDYNVPAGLNQSVLEKLNKRHPIFGNRYAIYSVAASIILIIILTFSFNFNKKGFTNSNFVSNIDTIKISTSTNDYASNEFLGNGYDDMIAFNAALYDDDKWTSDNTDIFDSDSDILNDLITLEELESYDDYLSSL